MINLQDRFYGLVGFLLCGRNLRIVIHNKRGIIR